MSIAKAVAGFVFNPSCNGQGERGQPIMPESVESKELSDEILMNVSGGGVIFLPITELKCPGSRFPWRGAKP